MSLVPTANKTLAVGANYYYLAFDLKADAPAGIDLDASFGELILSGSSQAISTPDPDGARRTSLQHIFEGGKDATVDVTSPLLFYDAGGPDHAAPKTTESGSVHFRPRAGEIIRCTVVRVANTKSQKLNLYSGASTDEKNLIHKLTSDDKASEAFISYAARTTKAGQYQATVRIGSTGNPVVTVSRVVKGKETSLGSYVMKQPYTAGQPLHLRMVVDGAESTNIQTKLWAGDAEPAEWGIEAVDNDKTLNEAGTVGLTTYMSGSAGPETVTLSVDKVTIKQH